MGAVKAHTWKKLVQQAEIDEKSAKKFKPSIPKNKGSTPRDVMHPSLPNQRRRKP